MTIKWNEPQSWLLTYTEYSEKMLMFEAMQKHPHSGCTHMLSKGN